MSNSQKSDDRLRKMRAGSNLVEVVNQTAPNADPLSSFETLDVQGTRNHFGEEQIQDLFQTHEAHNSLRRLKNNGRRRKIQVSEFMENYLSTKDFNEQLQLEKEKKLGQYFKEKLLLMSRYLGEGVLKEFLERPTTDKGTDRRPRDPYTQGDDDDYSPNHRFILQDGVSVEQPANPYAKVHKINREIIAQLMREEHEQHLENLRHLQIQQDMQAFNDLKEHPDRKRVITSESSPHTSTIRPTILKTNFIRTTSQSNEENSREQEFRTTSYKYPKTISQPQGRPVTSGSLVLRQNAPVGSEHSIPNLEKIVKNIEAVKVTDGFPEQKPKIQEERLSIQGSRDLSMSRESQKIRPNLFTSPQSYQLKDVRPITQQSEQTPLVTEEKVVEALEKYNENLKFLEIQKEIEKLPQVRPKTQETGKLFANRQRSSTSRAGNHPAFKFEEEIAKKKNLSEINSGSFAGEEPKEKLSPMETAAKTSSYFFMKPIKELSPKKPSMKHRNESTKSQESKSSFPFDGVETTKPIKPKKNPMNHYQRYALGKNFAEIRAEKEQTSSTGDLRPVRVPSRLHTNNSSSVLRPKKAEPAVVIPKPKSTATEMVNFKPAVLNLQLDPKKAEYTGYGASGNKNSIIIQQKKPSNLTWKQPLFG